MDEMLGSSNNKDTGVKYQIVHGKNEFCRLITNNQVPILEGGNHDNSGSMIKKVTMPQPVDNHNDNCNKGTFVSYWQSNLQCKKGSKESM